MAVQFTSEQRAAFARLFREARERRKMYQKDVAAATGVHPGTVALVEHGGAIESMRLVSILKLAHFLGISLNAIAEVLGFEFAKGL